MSKPEALRLADALSAAIKQVDADDDVIHVARWFVEDAAAELRRLHAENEAMRNVANRGGHIAVAMSRIADLESQRDALLEALKSTGLFLHHCWCDVQMNDHSFEKLNRQMEIVDAAIKAVEETK